VSKIKREVNKSGLVLILFLLLTTQDLVAETRDNVVELQSGSMLGLINLSYGWIFFDNHQVSVGAGYIPELKNHHELMLFSFKYRYQGSTTYKLNSISPTIKLSPVNFGVTGIVANNAKLFTRLTKPDKVPDDYYYPTGERFLVNYQLLLSLNEALGIYMDFSIIDTGLFSYVRNFNFYVDNYNYLGLEAVVNYGIGVRMTF